MENGLLLAEFHGAMSAADLLAGAAAVKALEETQAVTPPRIVDLSQVTEILVDFLTVDQFAEARAASKFKNPTRSAIVAPTDLQFGFARMYQLVSRNSDLAVEVFRDRKSAEDWLRLV